MEIVGGVDVGYFWIGVWVIGFGIDLVYCDDIEIVVLWEIFFGVVMVIVDVGVFDLVVDVCVLFVVILYVWEFEWL